MRLLPGLLAALLLGGALAAPAQPRPSAAPPPLAAPTTATTGQDGSDDRAAIADALPTEDEIKLGREGAVEAEREYKVVSDPAKLKRVEAIGREIIAASEDPHLIAAWLRQHPNLRPKSTKKRVPFAYTFIRRIVVS